MYDAAGIAFDPWFAINASSMPAGEVGFMANRTASELGPARAVVNVNWEMQMWPDSGGNPSGMCSSQFTLYPDGRIVRHDLVVPRTGASAVLMSTYTTFDGTRFDRAYRDRGGAVDEINPDNHTAANGSWQQGTLCLSNTGAERMVAVGWRRTDPMAKVAMMLETYPDVASHSVTLAVSWVDDYLADLFMYSADTMFVVRATDALCATIKPVIDGFEMPPDLVGTTYEPSRGAYVVENDVTQGELTLVATAAIPAGIGLEVSSEVDITRNGLPLEEHDVYLQQTNGSVTVVWLRDGLDPGDQLLLTARP